MQTIQDRGYVWKKGSALVPTFIAFAVVGLLEDHFSRLVDYRFTASVEDDLDDIAGGGDTTSTAWLTRFYFGSTEGGKEGGIARAGGLKRLVDDRLGDIDAREVNSIPIGMDPDGVLIVVRVGRYGPYVQRGSDEAADRANVPEDLAPDELTVEKAIELLSAPSGDRPLGPDPQTGEEITVRIGRFGPYVQRGEGDAATRASVFKSMDPTTVTIDDAVALLTLPRTLGSTPEGEEVTAQNGRYGPYVSKKAPGASGSGDSRSLESEDQLFTVTFDDAMRLFAQPKARGRGRAAAAPPLREMGNDPATGSPMVVKEGRFGPYVTDGETNASLRKGDEVESLTAERAAELLADRRARGPAPKKARARKAPAKSAAKATKSTPRKSPAKSTRGRS
jgi:DNA topoisomerase-1